MEKRFDVRLLKLQCGDCAQLLSDFVWRTATNLHHEKYKVAASATNQYSRHAACENGRLGHLLITTKKKGSDPSGKRVIFNSQPSKMLSYSSQKDAPSIQWVIFHSQLSKMLVVGYKPF